MSKANFTQSSFLCSFAQNGSFIWESPGAFLESKPGRIWPSILSQRWQKWAFYRKKVTQNDYEMTSRQSLLPTYVIHDHQPLWKIPLKIAANQAHTTKWNKPAFLQPFPQKALERKKGGGKWGRYFDCLVEYSVWRIGGVSFSGPHSGSLHISFFSQNTPANYTNSEKKKCRYFSDKVSGQQYFKKKYWGTRIP